MSVAPLTLDDALAPLPPPRRAAVRAAIDVALAGAPVTAVARLGGGMAATTVLRVDTAARALVVRAAAVGGRYVDPVRHHACLAVAAAAGVAPPLVHVDDAAGVTVSAHVAARPLAELGRPALLDALGALLRRLHAAPRFPPPPGDAPYVELVGAIVAELRAAGALGRAALLDRYDALAAACPRDPAARVASHNDVNPGNLIWDGARLWLVDWEAAFAADRWVDLAHASAHLAAGPDDEARLAAAYLGAPPDAGQRARLWAMRQVARMLVAAMMIQASRARGGAATAAVDADLERAAPLAEVRAQLPGLLASDARLHYARALLAAIEADLAAPDAAAQLGALAAS